MQLFEDFLVEYSSIVHLFFEYWCTTLQSRKLKIIWNSCRLYSGVPSLLSILNSSYHLNAFFLLNYVFFTIQPYLQHGDGPIVLVLAPTRELALQIKQECDKFGASSEIKNTVVYGGVPKHTQVRDLR